MRLPYFISFMMLLLFEGKAQYNSDFLYYSKYGKSATLQGSYDFNSNSVQNSIANQVVFGGYIDSSSRAKALGRMGAVNRAGGVLNYGANAFFSLRKNSKFSIAVGLNQTNMFNSTFSRDLFAMTFMGNKMYEGKTANIGAGNVNYYSFQEAKLGLVYDKGDTGIKAGFTVSYYNGQNILQMNTGRSSVFTASDASLIDFNLQGSVLISDTASGKQSIGVMNGKGAGASFFVEIPYTTSFADCKLFVSGSNIGFISWNSNTLQNNFNSNEIYKGVVTNNLFQVSGQSAQQFSRDSFLNKFGTFQKGPKTLMLPMNLVLINTFQVSDRYSFNLGARYIHMANYLPYVFTEGTIHFYNHLKLTFHAGYGGYGKLTGGFNFEYSIYSYYLRIGSNALQGYIAPKYTLGQGLFFSLTKKFS